MNRRLNLVCLTVALLVSLSSVLGAADLAKVFQDSYTQEAKGNLTEALRIIQDASGQQTDKITSYALKVRLAYLKSLMKKYAESAVLYGEAASIMPDSIEPLLAQEYQYLLLRDWNKVTEASLNALKIDPQNYLSRTRLAYAYYLSRDYASSAREYSNVLKLYPLDLGVKNMAGWAYAYAKDKTSSSQMFQEILTVSPTYKAAKDGLDYLKKI